MEVAQKMVTVLKNAIEEFEKCEDNIDFMNTFLSLDMMMTHVKTEMRTHLVLFYSAADSKLNEVKKEMEDDE